jgi:zinc/manganese transport system substrate-binding protein
MFVGVNAVEPMSMAHGPARLDRRWPLVVLAVVSVVAVAGCGRTTSDASTGAGRGNAPGASPTAGRVIDVVAAENFWGSIAAQVGGTHVRVTSIITNPNADPHAYEPTPTDGRAFAVAQVAIVNGVGYDPWAPELLAADPGRRTVLNVGKVLGLTAGDNPHRWYNPDNVQTVISAYVADLVQLDPADAEYFRAQQTRFDRVDLGPYDRLIARIRATYSGTPVGASESIFSMLAPALGLDVVTPYSFLKAISEGTDVSAADKTSIDNQIRKHQIKIYVYNSQNTTPDVQAQLMECRAAHIPTATITETLAPASATYEDWQTTQLQGILTALNQASGR